MAWIVPDIKITGAENIEITIIRALIVDFNFNINDVVKLYKKSTTKISKGNEMPPKNDVATKVIIEKKEKK